MLKYAFSSNAFKQVTLEDAARQIAAAGYVGMEVMADIPHAFPPDFDQNRRREFRELLERLHLQVSNINAFTLFAVGDTYHPTFLEENLQARRVRISHTIAAVNLAADLGATTLSIQPGGPTIGTGLSRQQAMTRFAEALEEILPSAREKHVVIAIEPEPGLLIQTVAEFVEFKQRYFSAETCIAMNCDMGHLFCVGDDPVTVVRDHSADIAHVHLEDIAKNRVHQHLQLGDGAMDLPGIIHALESAAYAGWVTVELYPYVKTAQEVATHAMEYLLKQHV